MAYGCEPMRLTRKGFGGNIERITFGVFFQGPMSSIGDTQVVANTEFGGEYCEVTGVWYPKSRIRIDGIGRHVGDGQYTTPPIDWDGTPL